MTNKEKIIILALVIALAILLCPIGLTATNKKPIVKDKCDTKTILICSSEYGCKKKCINNISGSILHLQPGE